MQKVPTTGRVDAGRIAARVVERFRSGALELGEPPPAYKSGVYCLVDAVFRARTDHATVVVPMLRDRLAARPGMRDRAALRFRDLLADVDAIGGDKLEAYAAEVLNRQRIAGRRKAAILCEAAALLGEQGLETKRHLMRLHPFDRERVALADLTRITGFGEGLGRHLLEMLGHAEPVRPDRVVRRFLGEVGGWTPDPRADGDEARARDVLARAARRLRRTPLRVVAAIHRAEGTR
jgi:hypothetical protein